MSTKKQSEHDEVWQLVMNVVVDSLSEWRRRVSDVTGMPFSRARALRRLAGGPITMSELALCLETDAPAATVIVNALEEQGLVARVPDPEDRRVKRVSLTAAGEKMYARTRSMPDIAPASLKTLSPEDLAALKQLMTTLVRARDEGGSSPVPG